MPPASLVFGKGFNYLSGSTPEAVAYFRSLAGRFIKEFGLKKGDYVLDVGSNDGEFLRNFRGMGIEVLGVDPAPGPAKAAEKRGVPTIVGPFEDSFPEVTSTVGRRLRLITAFNVLAHTDRVHKFLDLTHTLCETTGAHFVSQSHYLADMVERLEWDTVYHEHARYYSLISLDQLLWRHRLKLYHAERASYYGGSFLSYASSDWFRRSKESLQMEKREGQYRESVTFRHFAGRVDWGARRLAETLGRMKSEGKTIVGFGAPMKSSTLLNYCHIGPEVLDYLAEVNPMKVGTYSPGTHIPVLEESHLLKDQPDAILVLAWNVAERVMRDLRHKGFEGKFVLPDQGVRVL